MFYNSFDIKAKVGNFHCFILMMKFDIMKKHQNKEGNLNVLRSAGFSPFKIISICSLGALLLVIPLLVLDDLALRKIYLDAQKL